MHSIITVLANRYKIPISGRACGGGDLNQPCWDGKNLATYWVRFEYNDNDVCIVQHRVPISDAELLHEIGHYVAAREEQRDLPEYGLGAVVFTTYHFWDSCPSVVDEVEGFVQEFLAVLLEVYWGQLNCLPFVLSYGADWAKSKQYCPYGRAEPNDSICFFQPRKSHRGRQVSYRMWMGTNRRVAILCHRQ